MLNVKVGDKVMRHIYGWSGHEMIITVKKITPAGYIVCDNGKRYRPDGFSCHTTYITEIKD